MLGIESWPTWGIVVLFAGAAVVILFAGAKLAGLADELADRTGLGEAMLGGIFLGVTTSLPGITTSVTTAIDGFAALSVSNALGGIAAQTVFLAVADMCYRRVNLEHAAASPVNLVQSAMLVSLLTLVILIMSGPDWTIFHIHPGTPLLFVAYAFGVRLVHRMKKKPTWRAEQTSDTVSDEPDDAPSDKSLSRMWVMFSVFAAAIFVAGFLVGKTGESMVERFGMSETVVGGLVTAIALSLPELVTCIAAVRRGALTLAVADIVGGNMFDVLFLCVSDVAFQGGSIYHAPAVTETGREGFLAGLCAFLNIVLLLGLLSRERRGIGGIGFDSFVLVVAYIGGFVIAATVL